MSLPAPYSEVYLAGDGVTTEFAFGTDFTPISAELVKCSIYLQDGYEIIPTYTVDMTVGSITISALTLPDNTVLTAPPIGSTVRIYRDEPEAQNVTASQLQAFTAKQLERALDAIVAMIQEVSYTTDHKTIRLTEPQRDIALQELGGLEDGHLIYWDNTARKLVVTNYPQQDVVRCVNGLFFRLRTNPNTNTPYLQWSTDNSDWHSIDVDSAYALANDAYTLADSAYNLASTTRGELSAHINNTQNPHQTSMANLTDTDLSDAESGQFLQFDGVKWKATSSTASVSWGSILGDIDDQTDLKIALDAKQDELTAGDNITITRLVPDGYDVLEYIESDGTQYINTLVPVNISNSFDIDCVLLSGNSDAHLISEGNVSIRVGANAFTWYTQAAHYLSTFTPGDNYNIQCGLNYLTVNGNTISGTTDSDNVSGASVYLLAKNTAASQCKARIKHVKIYDANSDLAFDGTPAIRNADGVVGLYDSVSETFFANSDAGASNFIAGDKIASTVISSTADSLPSQTGNSGKFLTTDGTDASWAAVDALPSQTGNNGKFLTTDGTDASWSNKPLVNSASNPTSSYIIGGVQNLTGLYKVVIGYQAKTSQDDGIAIGHSCNSDGQYATSVGKSIINQGENGVAVGHMAQIDAYSSNTVAIGYSARCSSSGAIAIGQNTRASGAKSIQLGSTGNTTTNSDSNTFKVANANGNFEIMSADGTIPTDRFTTTPSTDGTYVPTLTISSGVVTRSWGSGGSSSYHPDLFDWKWADHQVNDVQWLRADTFSWQSGSVYKAAYKHLRNDMYNWYSWANNGTTIYTKKAYPEVGEKVYSDSALTTEVGEITAVTDTLDITVEQITVNGVVYDSVSGSNIAPTTETVGGVTVQYILAEDGHKIVTDFHESEVADIYAATGVAWYYIIDYGFKRFKLPRTKYGFTGLRDVVGKYVPESLPNITGTVGGAKEFRVTDASGAFSLSGEKTSSGQAGTTGSDYHAFSLDASDSSSAYQDNAPVQQRATQMYLYFYVGEFTQTAIENTAGLNAELFNDKVDVGHEVIEFQAPTAQNNYTWYRKYADGWVEQGGFVSNVPGEQTVNFPITMADTNYAMFKTMAVNSSNNVQYSNVSFYARTTASAKTTTAGADFSWEVKGMAQG